MKNFLFGIILVSMSLFGSEQLNDNVLKNDYKNTKEFVEEIKTKFPIVHEIISDYFQAKVCKEDFTNEVSIDDIKDFTASYKYGVLIGFMVTDKNKYEVLNNSNKFMNCGNKEALDNFITNISKINE